MGTKPDLKGILIDFGSTIAYIDERENKEYEIEIQSILEKHGCHADLAEVSSTFSTLYMNSTEGKMKSLREFWMAFLRKLKSTASEKLIDDLSKARQRRSSSIFKLYEGVAPTLNTLKRRYKLALVSNCAVGLIDTIGALGLVNFFDHIVLSYEVGVRKPDKRIYLEALRRMKLAGDQCIFVADEVSDLEGAKAVGMMTMLVRNELGNSIDARDQHFQPDFVCENIAQITEFL